jgi:hypothetical protein
LFDRRPFLRPDLPRRQDAARRRRQGWPLRSALAARSGLARPRLDGGEHGVMLAQVGTEVIGLFTY